MPITRRFFDMRILLLLALCLPAALLADDKRYEPHDNIIEAARRHVLERADDFAGEITVKVSRPDRRLRLALCGQPLQTYQAPSGLKPGRGVVGVRCEGPKPWKIYVSVHIATLQPVVVTRQPLARGQLVTAADLEMDERNTARLHKAYYADTAQVVGLRAKRSIRVGKVVTAGMLARDQVVKRGSRVEILARGDGLQVRMRGKALVNGALGDRIRVKNLSSGREVTGLVIEPGVILVQQ